MAARKSLLRYTENMARASAEISNSRQGAVTQRLSSVLFVASFMQSFDERVLVESSAAPSSANHDNPDELSNLMIDAWAIVQSKALINPTLTRRISLEKTGTVAVALVIESEIRNEALPLVLAGAQSLALMRPSISFIMVPHFVLSTSIPGLTDSLSIPPQTGITASRVPSARITAWPSATPFNDQLFCFYQGFNGRARRLLYNVYDGNTWVGEKEVPNTLMSEGPSTVVFNNKLYCFKQGDRIAAQIWYNIFDGVNWSGDQLLPAALVTAGPSAVVFNDKIYCFYQGRINDHRIWYNVFDGIEWEGNKTLSTTSHITGSPSAVLFDNLIHVFYQGFGTTENHVMEIVFNPSTGGVDRDARQVPNMQRMSEGPSTVVVQGKLYLFHQDETGGKLYVNVSGDGDEWAQDTLVEDVNLTMGPASTSFNNELYFFFQRGELGKVTDGELWYRKLELARGGSIGGEGAQGDPSLEQLGYGEGYEGYRDFADKMRDSHKADSGYVVYITKLPLLFNVYADETRMCMQYTDPSFIHLHFPTMFSAEGTFDQRIVGNTVTGYPPRPDTRRDPRYTFAWVNNWNDVLTVANMMLFHRGQGNDRNTHLWVVFLDKRNSRWIEMQGPAMSPNTSIRIGAPTPMFDSSSRLYVLYNNNSEILCYNVLGRDTNNNLGEAILWGVEKVASRVHMRNTPSSVCVNQNMIRVYVEAPNSRIGFTSLNTHTNHWADVKEASQINGNGSPSAVHYLDKIYVFYRGSSGVYFNKLAYSIWEKEEETWIIGTSIDSSPYGVDAEPSAVVYKDVVYCFYTHNNTLWYSIFNGHGWARATLVNMAHNQSRPMAGGVSALVWQDKIHCFFRLDLSVARPMLYYKVFDITQNLWSEEIVLPTASGLSSKPGAVLNQLLIGSSSDIAQ